MKGERCPALMACADGSFVRCTESAATSGPDRFHVGYVDGWGRVTWKDTTDGACVGVSIGRRRRLSELLEARR